MRPRRLQTCLSLLLLLLCGGCRPAVSRRAEEPAPGPSRGRFVSPEGHACSWQLLLPAPGPAELALRCRGPDGAHQACTYRGAPERCAAYPARRALYWKQVLGALRRRRRPCQDPAPLRARLCAGRKGPGAELRLRPAAPPPAGLSREPKARARSRGRPRQAQPERAQGAPPSPPREKLPPRPTQVGKKKAVVASDPEHPPARGTPADPDGLDGNAQLAGTYCAEKWHSLCDFFVNFWNG
ncbi:fibroblast growth factor-binding protein 3 [Sorex fumeus]|uniref:fibroblast growth factor-binding protein 3 n=1 Tax=Sorex fumeus TaxID=62283 RepID=UPI0024AD49E4|nr:fibroblast growth factor-binding protein 3 [Sorex fumeus]